MGERVVIRTRFRGPPNSAQGGYTCGLLAGRIDGAAEVSLRSPPPLDAPLEIRAEAGDRVVLLDGGELVADGRPSPLELEPPRPVTLAEAEAGSAACPWIDRHPLPQCFGCGPDRDVPDGLRLLPGPVVGREVWAAPWTPDPSVADEEGVVQPTVVWAALDCPTSFPTVPQGRPCVLARMRARLESPVRAGVPHTVVAWPIGHEGRRHLGGAAIHDPDERLCGLAEGLWIELRDPASMGARV